jgi:hypothetical protein
LLLGRAAGQQQKKRRDGQAWAQHGKTRFGKISMLRSR